MTEPLPNPADDICKSDFNYCFWAKLFVAIPAIPLAALLSASFFKSFMVQMVIVGVVTFLIVFGAVTIDRMPCFSSKVVKR